MALADAAKALGVSARVIQDAYVSLLTQRPYPGGPRQPHRHRSRPCTDLGDGPAHPAIQTAVTTTYSTDTSWRLGCRVCRSNVHFPNRVASSELDAACASGRGALEGGDVGASFASWPPDPLRIVSRLAELPPGGAPLSCGERAGCCGVGGASARGGIAWPGHGDEDVCCGVAGCGHGEDCAGRGGGAFEGEPSSVDSSAC